MKKINLVAALGLLCVQGCSNLSGEYLVYQDPSCDTEDAYENHCGVLYYYNTGNYNIDVVHLYAESTQPDAPINANCPGFDYEKGNNGGKTIDTVTFTIPADCAYHFRVGLTDDDESKTRDVFLTPGCKITLETKGKGTGNWADTEAVYIDGESGIPVDSEGNQCGNLGDM